MAQIFVSYRRDDTGDFWADEIVRMLVTEFGTLNVFKDTQSIRTASNWQETLQQKLEEAKVVVVLIGVDFFNLKGPSGVPRIQEANDVVRQEIREALRMDKAVVPVLLSQAKIPPSSSIPEDIRKLFRFQTFSIDRVNDIQRLMDWIGSQLPAASRTSMSALRSRSLGEGIPFAEIVCAKAFTEALSRLAALGWYLWPVSQDLYLYHPHFFEFRFLVYPKKALLILQIKNPSWKSRAIFDVLPLKSSQQLLDLPENLRSAASNPSHFLTQHGDVPLKQIRKMVQGRSKKEIQSYIEQEWNQSADNTLKYRAFLAERPSDRLDIEHLINPKITAPKSQSATRTIRQKATESIQLQEAAILFTDRFSWVQFHPTIPILTSALLNNNIALWNLENLQEAPEPVRMEGHRHDWRGTVNYGKFSKDGRLATGDTDGTIRIWDVEIGAQLKSYKVGTTTQRVFKKMDCSIHCLDWSSDTQLLAAFSRDNRIHLWDTRYDIELDPVKADRIEHGILAFHPSKPLLATNAKGATIDFYDITNDSWGLQIPFSTNGEIDFSPDGKLLAAGNEHGQISLFDAKTGKERTVLKGHDTSEGASGINPITSLQFSPNGQWLASLSRDPFLIVWDVASGQPAAVYEHKRDFIFLGGLPQLSWFWDSKWLALPVIGGEIRILAVMESEFV